MSEDVHIRDIVKYTEYKRFGTTTKVFYGGQENNRTTDSNRDNSRIRRPSRNKVRNFLKLRPYRWF